MKQAHDQKEPSSSYSSSKLEVKYYFLLNSSYSVCVFSLLVWVEVHDCSHNLLHAKIMVVGYFCRFFGKQ